MTTKVTETESKITITKTVCICDTCGKVVTHLQYPISENGKPYECSDCFMTRINKETIEKNKNLLGAVVTDFKIDWGNICEITLKCADGTKCVIDVSNGELEVMSDR